MTRLQLFLFNKHYVEANELPFNIFFTTPHIFQQKKIGNNYASWKSGRSLNEEKLKLAFQQSFQGINNIVCLQLKPGKINNAKRLQQNFPLYASSIYESFPNCDGILFKTYSDIWLNARGLELIKEKYSKITIFGINFFMIKNIGNISTLAEKIFSYQNGVDAVYFDINDRDFKHLKRYTSGRNFYEEIDRELQVAYQTRK